MKTYILKRILFMIPTFFVISFILFVILNFAPGKPGASAQAGVTEKLQEAGEGNKREAYKIFKYQFNLDKPVFYNTRFLLTVDDVEKALKTSINWENAYKTADILKYQEICENYGEDIVPHLINLMNSADNIEFKRQVMYQLSMNAQRRVISKYKIDNDEATRELNKKIDVENEQIKRMSLKSLDNETIMKEKILLWNSWYDTVKYRYERSFNDKIKMFFFETRFAKYWSNLFKFDFGISHVDKRPVIQMILSKMKYSLSLSVPSLMLSFIIALPLGIFSAVFKDTIADRISTLIVFMLYSLPTFFVATLLLFVFSEGSNYFHWFPTGGFQDINSDELTLIGKTKDILHHLALPLFCMTYGGFAALSRYGRTSLLEVINADYIRTARAKGLAEYVVILKHAVRNGMIPIITLMGTILPVILGGSVIIEVIFNIPGMGTMSYNAIMNRDYNVIMGFNLISIILTLTGLVISDVLYVIADPRIKLK